MKLKINAKLLIAILSTTSLIYITSIGYITYTMRNIAMRDAMQLTDAYASRFANVAKSKLDEDMAVVRTIAQSFLGYKGMTPENRRVVHNQILRDIYAENPQYLAVWASWEFSAIDSSYKKPYGRLRTEVFKQSGNIFVKQEPLNMEGDVINRMYYKYKISGHNEFITETYMYNYTSIEGDSMIESSLAVSIKKEGKFLGMVGIDVALNRFQEITNAIKPYENSYAFLLTNGGKFVAHPSKDFINKSVTKLMSEDETLHHLSDKIRDGERFSFIEKNDNGSESYVTFVPVSIGRTNTPWSIGIVVPIDVIMSEANRYFYITSLVATFGFIILALIVWFSARYISRPLVKISYSLKELAKGVIDDSMKMSVKSQDEIGEIRSSLNTLIDALKSTSRFAQQIGKGNLSVEFNLLSEDDMLGHSLLEMRKSIETAKIEEEKRKEEDRKYNWATQGYARFGEILRENNDDMKKFAYEIIKNLIQYIEADQGGLYLKIDDNDDDIHVALFGAFAYSGEKLMKKRIEIGENLVGICVQTGEFIHMTDVPDNYINTSSGLGSHKPKNLLIVPLKYNEAVLGAIELASFKDFARYQIEFITKAAESIASSISNIKLNIRTKQLLEESKKISLELQVKEDIMQKNMEEMEHNNVESAKRQAEMKNLLDAINSISLIAEYDMEGRLININDGLCEMFQVTKNELIGRYQGSFEIGTEVHVKTEKFRTFWNDLKKGISKKMNQHLQIGGKEVYISETYTPIFDNNGVPYKVLNLAVDITDRVKAEMTRQKLEGN